MIQHLVQTLTGGPERVLENVVGDDVQLLLLLPLNVDSSTARLFSINTPESIFFQLVLVEKFCRYDSLSTQIAFCLSQNRASFFVHISYRPTLFWSTYRFVLTFPVKP